MWIGKKNAKIRSQSFAILTKHCINFAPLAITCVVPDAMRMAYFPQENRSTRQQTIGIGFALMTGERKESDMKSSRKRRKTSRRSRPMLTTFRAIILEGTGIIALILLISMARSGRANPIKPLSEQAAIHDLREWFSQFRAQESTPSQDKTVPASDFGQGFSIIRGDRTAQTGAGWQKEDNSTQFPVRRADYNSMETWRHQN